MTVVDSIRPSANPVTATVVGHAGAGQKSPSGLAMLLAFPAAVLIITIAVVGLALAETWLALAATMVVDAFVTFGVSLLTARLLADDGD